MSIPKFEFSRRWTEPADFPTIETDETQVRADLQALHDETRDYFNAALLPQIDSEIGEMKSWVTETAASAVLGQLPDASVKEEKLAEGAVTSGKLASGAVSQDKLDPDAKLPNPKALRVGEQRYDGTEEVELSSDGLKLDSASAAALGLAENASMNEALAALAPALGSLRVTTGRYVGTGGVGSGSPTVIDFGFQPKLVLVGKPQYWPALGEAGGTLHSEGVIWFEGIERMNYVNAVASDYDLWTNFAVEGTALKIWGTETHGGDDVPTPTADSQYNASGTSYVYIGLGVKEGA